MSQPIRRPQRVYSVVMWILSFVFAACLIGLGSLVIRDLPRVETHRSLDSFADHAALEQARGEADELRLEISDLRRLQEDERTDLRAAQNDYEVALENHSVWLANRVVTEADEQNPEIIARTEMLEARRDAVRAAQAELDAVGLSITQIERAQSDVSAELSELRAAARPEYEAYRQGVQMRVFLLRLAVTLPLLIISGVLLARFRQSNYWPLCRGFVIASAFAFFVELVPYLPSYGGYVRYGVGIVLILIAGHFIIRAMMRYLERQKVAEARSEIERRKSIENDVALKKLEAGTCPGCDRPVVTKDGVQTDFCAHCGMKLNEDCAGCGTHKIAFHNFCLACGHDCRDQADPASNGAPDDHGLPVPV
ncbi:zinc ribbon domain-containing protein [Ponticaulis sp.]|uniref:zinc ribbon domain-containing protein n=1 Tax=Ponticaulis sp. TaxID=2020902 RepID=UPI000B6E6F56|nr:zinc ribbon domain-containing protein [Ponticaulis sp.]MAI90081.1 hypothetical protein [Ponticaulis sp.]OUX99737.1 MAG: hypothetical protein CBB65_06545 [Hyphomonadaceae bacterium TMED5]|tara:strand:+ start:39156 stop:40253 length:1098 start_codon:yes stop_codon:yes gene_type:complete